MSTDTAAAPAPRLTPEQIEALDLKSGSHNSPEDGMCLLEATALFSGEPFSDAPDYLLAEQKDSRRKSIRLHGVTWDVQWDEEHDDPEPYHYQFGTVHSAGSAYWVTGVLVNGLWLDREAFGDEFSRALDRALIDGMGA